MIGHAYLKLYPSHVRVCLSQAFKQQQRTSAIAICLIFTDIHYSLLSDMSLKRGSLN